MPYITKDGELIEISQEQFDAEHYCSPEQHAKNVRFERNRLLAETDWWAVADRTMTQAETDYRQALRDVPAQAGFPENITWPTKP